MREGLRYARSVPELWMPLVMMAVIGTLAFNFQVVVPLFVTEDLGGSDTTFTLLYLGRSASARWSARWSSAAPHDDQRARRGRRTRRRSASSMACSRLTPAWATSFPVALLVGFASIAFMTASTAIVQIRAEPEMRGRVLALQAMVFLGSTPIGGPILGWVCDRFGARAGFLVGGLGALGAAGWGFLRDGGRNPLRRQPVAANEPANGMGGPITRETPLVH